MRWLFNCILVVVGVPLLGITFLFIISLSPGLRNDFKWPDRIYILAMWLINLMIFSFIYVKRTKWLENAGIFKSWPNFKAYMEENHGDPPVSLEEKQEFLSWANLPEEHPEKFREKAKEIYNKINKESEQDLSSEKRKTFTKCLAWYMGGWPIEDDEFEEDNNHITTQSS